MNVTFAARRFVTPTAALVFATTAMVRAQDASRQGPESSDAALSRLIDTSLQSRTLDVAPENPPVLSPDGKRLAFSASTVMTRTRDPIPRFPFRSRRPTELFVLEIDTQQVSRVSPDGGSGWQPVWAPDGASLVFYSDAGGRVRLWAHDPASGESRRVSEAWISEGFIATKPAQFGPTGREVFVALEPPGPSPSPGRQTTVAVYRSGREAEVEYAPSRQTRRADAGFARSFAGHLAAVDVVSGEVRLILAAHADPPPQRPYLSPSGRWLFYTSPPRHNLWLFRGERPPDSLADFSTDLAVVPTTGGSPALLEADVDMDAAVWHPSRDVIAYVKAGDLWVRELDGDGRWARRQLARELGPVEGSPVVFSADGSSLLVVRRSSSGTGTPVLAVAPLDGTAGTPISIPDHLWFVRLAVDARGVLWPPDEGSAAALFEDRRSGDVAIWRLDLATGRGLEAWRGRGGLVFADMSKESAGLVASFEDPRSPPDLYLFSSDLSDKRRLTRTSPELDDAVDDLVGPIEYFTTRVPAFDGTLLEVRTAVITPRGATRNGTARGIVCIYPGADFSMSAQLWGGAERCGLPSYLLAARGFTVILPHLVKRPRYTKGNVAQEYCDALLPVVYRAAALGYVDVGRVALFGHSQGAYAATAIISETNLFRAAIAASSLTYDLVGGFGYMRPDFSVPNLVPIISHLMSAPPWDDLKRYIVNSPYLQADKITTPLLLLVGTSDRFPHVEEAGKLFNALSTYDKTAQLAVYEHEDHLLFRGSLSNASDLWKRVLDFLDRYAP